MMVRVMACLSVLNLVEMRAAMLVRVMGGLLAEKTDNMKVRMMAYLSATNLVEMWAAMLVRVMAC